jgi:energy-coupling factor transporter transmembrane protein EcfT
MTNERKLYKSIYFKSFSVLLLAITFIFIVNIYTYYLNIKESLYTELKNDTSITVEQIESLTKHFLKSYEVYEYEKLIRNFMNNKRIFAIVIDDYHTGKILGSNDGIYSTGSIRDKDWSVINYTKSHTKELNSSYFFVKKALLGDDTEEILGYISVYSSDKDIQENLKSLLISLILDKMVIFILIILVIFFIINRLILKPIDTLILSIRDKDSDGIPKNKLKLTNSVETNIC